MRRMFLITFTLALMAFQVPILSFSQHQIFGYVGDAETGDPLPGAHVVIVGFGMNTTTNANGIYSIKNVGSGKYMLRFSYVGYQTVKEQIDLGSDLELNVLLNEKAIMSEEVIVTATRTTEDEPSTYSTVTKTQIEKYNTGQDLPYIMQLTPSVVTSSDAGGGIGYTGIRIRGTDITRINVTMNGVPVNDAESHGVYFVDLPDLASSIENIQIQRGVGTSTNGAAAFGASINIKTTGLNPDPYAEINSAAGSFNTLKNTISFGSGLVNGKWAFDGRLSDIRSDGYIDRGWSDLQSMYLSGGYFGDKTIVKAIMTLGREKTYQAWNGIPKDSLETNRTYNPSGAMYDDEGNLTGYYKNETDNYGQDYYQLHIAHRFSNNLNATAALFYTHGEGYYENFRNKNSFSSYGFQDVMIGDSVITQSDMVRQKWLDNDYYGFNLALNYKTTRLKTTLGGGFNTYSGDHFGYIIWAEFAGESFIDKPWYENTGNKSDGNLFLKVNYELFPALSIYGDAQVRSINYSIEGTHDDLRDLTQSHDFFFFNPKAGAVYKISDHRNVYGSVAIAHREPQRGVYRDADPGQDVRSERLIDYELGYRFGTTSYVLEVNGYYMDYKDQLVLTGQINNVGDAILVNVPESYRMGVELAASVKLLDQLKWDINATLSRNKIKNFVSYTDDWNAWPEQVVENLGTTDISFSPDVIAASSVQISPVDGFEATWILRYVGRQYIDNTSSLERSLDPYLVNDLRFEYVFNPGLLKSVGVFLSLQNILNEEYASNAWVYRYYLDNEPYELNGYFPQAKFNVIGGVDIKF